MVYYDNTSAEKIKELLDSLIKQTEQHTIKWNCTNYSPICLMYDDEIFEAKRPHAELVQMFDVECILDGNLVLLSLCESISVDSEKGLFYGDITIDNGDFRDKHDFSLNYDFDAYDNMSAEEVADFYSDHEITRLYDVVIPIIAHSGAVKENFWYARLINQTDVPQKYLSHPLVKLAELMLQEQRVLDFHNIVLNVRTRKQYLKDAIK